ncbi:discoidin domain-containing protein, partial [Mycobacterium sp. E1386]|uniref:discoidin domain-containing protein n=1 Tax=Mycobacterium sp. E1386 TaxID=1834126 RepID=UPI001E3BEEFA
FSSVADSGLRPRYPAVEVYRVEVAGDPGAPYFADVDRLPRVDGGPEALLRLDERRRLQGLPTLGPALMTADARGAGLPVPSVTVTDTPVARETDYGRVDQHSSAIRAAGDARHTYNRVPDYPVPGADPVVGAWSGGRITVSSSSSDSTAMPDVAPATSPVAAIDGDPATAWVSNSLQSAVGQWLQVDFDHPVTNAAITLTPSATAVGAQVRRILIETATGSTTLRFDEPGKPLAAALPYGETPWVRITAAGTDDGSPGVQFGITDLSITQYDASGFAHQLDLRHTVRVPGPPPGAAVAGWDLGSELLGRPGCASTPEGVRCAPSMALTPEEPVNLSRTLTVPAPMSVTSVGRGRVSVKVGGVLCCTTRCGAVHAVAGSPSVAAYAEPRTSTRSESPRALVVFGSASRSASLGPCRGRTHTNGVTDIGAGTVSVRLRLT